MTLLLCILHAAALSAPLPAQDARPERAPAPQGLEAVLAEWEQALEDHKAELKRARKQGDTSAVKARHPAKTFYPRFEQLSAAGEGRALLWMAENAEDAFADKHEVAEQKRALWTSVVTQYASADWAESIPAALARQKRYLDEQELRSLMQTLGERSQHTEVAAESFSRLADLLDGRKATDEEKARAKELRERVLRDYPTSFAAIEIDPDKYKEAYLSVGKPAPDFTCADVDGTEFKLSDYRGKVVMLDFWGFW